MKTFRFLLLFVFIGSCAAPLWADSSRFDAGGYHFLGVKSNAGEVVGLGDSTYGQLGSSGGLVSDVGGLSDVVQVAAGGFSSIVLKQNGTVWFLGETTLQYTTPHGTPNPVSTPEQVEGLSGIDAIVAGARHYLTLDHDGGKLYAWGHNGSGQVGNNNLRDVQSPVLVLADVLSMSAGERFSLAVKTDGTVWGWGSNSHGQLGLGDTVDRLIPTAVSGISNAVAVAAGGRHSLILLADGSVLAFGDNAFGQLGLGATNSVAVPTAVSALTGITAIATGFHHSAAINSDGQAFLWGRNFEGQCGGGDTSPVRLTTPQPLTLEAPVGALACGYHFTVFELTNATLWGTGSNSDGQLDGTSVAEPFDSQKILTPQRLPFMLDLTIPSVDAGRDVISWSSAPVTLDATVVNNTTDPVLPLTYAWSIDADSLADTNLEIVLTDADQEDATVQITKLTPTGDVTVVTMTLAANNEGSGKRDITDTLSIYVYDTNCKATIAAGLEEYRPTDFDRNCVTDFGDLAIMAAAWFQDSSLQEPVMKSDP